MTPEQAIEKLEALPQYSREYRDYEDGHLMADKILCDLLKFLGHGDVVEAWEKVGKFYS